MQNSYNLKLALKAVEENKNYLEILEYLVRDKLACLRRRKIKSKSCYCKIPYNILDREEECFEKNCYLTFFLKDNGFIESFFIIKSREEFFVHFRYQKSGIITYTSFVIF
jgi:hypothetical protein